MTAKRRWLQSKTNSNRRNWTFRNPTTALNGKSKRKITTLMQLLCLCVFSLLYRWFMTLTTTIFSGSLGSDFSHSCAVPRNSA